MTQDVDDEKFAELIAKYRSMANKMKDEKAKRYSLNKLTELENLRNAGKQNAE